MRREMTGTCEIELGLVIAQHDQEQAPLVRTNFRRAIRTRVAAIRFRFAPGALVKPRHHRFPQQTMTATSLRRPNPGKPGPQHNTEVQNAAFQPPVKRTDASEGRALMRSRVARMADAGRRRSPYSWHSRLELRLPGDVRACRPLPDLLPATPMPMSSDQRVIVRAIDGPQRRTSRTRRLRCTGGAARRSHERARGGRE